MSNTPRSSSEGTAACLRADAAASGMSLPGSVPSSVSYEAMACEDRRGCQRRLCETGGGRERRGQERIEMAGKDKRVIRRPSALLFLFSSSLPPSPSAAARLSSYAREESDCWLVICIYMSALKSLSSCRAHLRLKRVAGRRAGSFDLIQLELGLNGGIR
jgi:hypothetical protein